MFGGGGGTPKAAPVGPGGAEPFLCPPPFPDAYNMAKLLCDKYYMASPELEIEEVNGEGTAGPRGQRGRGYSGGPGQGVLRWLL